MLVAGPYILHAAAVIFLWILIREAIVERQAAVASRLILTLPGDPARQKAQLALIAALTERVARPSHLSIRTRWGWFSNDDAAQTRRHDDAARVMALAATRPEPTTSNRQRVL